MISSPEGRNNSYVEVLETEEGYAHIAYFDVYDHGTPTRWLTGGEWEIDKIYGIDSKKRLVYFSSTEVHSTQRHIYSVSLDSPSSKVKLTPIKGESIKSVVPTLSIKMEMI